MKGLAKIQALSLELTESNGFIVQKPQKNHASLREMHDFEWRLR